MVEKKQTNVRIIESDGEPSKDSVTFVSSIREFRYTIPSGKDVHLLQFRNSKFTTANKAYIEALQGAKFFGTAMLQIMKNPDTKSGDPLECQMCGYRAKDVDAYASHLKSAHQL